MAADDIEGKLTVMLNLIIIKKEIAFLMASTFFVITAFDHLRITKEVIVSQILTKKGRCNLDCRFGKFHFFF